MQSYKQQCSWRILVGGKANHFNFNLRFRATSFGANWTLHRFSFILRFRNLLVLRFNSHPVAPGSRLGLFRNRVVSVIQKFQARIMGKNRSTCAKHPKVTEFTHSMLCYTLRFNLRVAETVQDPIQIGLWVLLAFIIESIWRKYGKVVFIIAASVGFMAGLLMKRAKLVKARGVCNFIAVIVTVIAACSLLVHMFERYWDNRMAIFVAKQVWDLTSS